MGKRNLPPPAKTLGRQECSVLSSRPEEESWAEELLTGKITIISTTQPKFLNTSVTFPHYSYHH